MMLSNRPAHLPTEKRAARQKTVITLALSAMLVVVASMWSGHKPKPLTQSALPTQTIAQATAVSRASLNETLQAIEQAEQKSKALQAEEERARLAELKRVQALKRQEEAKKQAERKAAEKKKADEAKARAEKLKQQEAAKKAIEQKKAEAAKKAAEQKKAEAT
ncbi:MAG: hypothetical protein Q4B71_03885, partial [Cardiobacteriaceae bacterium]|nr:hypothetical protein [Cardiobacteriaceae bacterium]